MWPTTEQSLLRKLRKTTDEAAWSVFIDVYYPLVKRVCLLEGLSKDDAEDVCQIVFRDLHLYLPNFRYDPEKGLFRSWLSKCVENEVNRRRKSLSIEKSKREKSGDNHGLLTTHSGGFESELITGMYHLILQTALKNIKSQFSQERWYAFEQTWLNEQCAQAIADELGRELAWVRMWKSKIKHRLKEEVTKLAQDMEIAENE